MSVHVRWTVVWVLLLLGIVASPTLSPVAYAQEKTLVWERFDVDIEVLRNGTFEVSEHQTIRFTSGSFRNGYRDIPINNFEYIDGWEVTDEDGNVYRQSSGGSDPYTFTVDEQGGRYVVNWYFPPTANAAATYTLRYTVHGGLRFYENGDQVWWKAIYGDRSFPVLAGRVRVVVPNGATIQEWAAYINEADARGPVTAMLLEGSQAVTFDLQERLNAGEELEVRVEFTPNVVDGAPAAWQAAADQRAAERDAELAFQRRWGPVATLALCAVGLLFAFGGPAAVYAFWYRRGRDKPVSQIAEYLPEPPSPLAPGLAGTLIDERVDMEDIIATLIDLARRKAISITEVTEEGFLRSGTDFIYRRERTDVPLLPYEQKLLDALFGNKDEVELSELKNKFYTKIDGIKKSLYEEAVKQGLFPVNPDSVRSQFGCLGIGALVLAALVGFVLAGFAAPLSAFGFAPGVGLGITAIALIVVAQFMPRKSDKGAEEAARWQAFKTYLRNIDKYSDIEAQKEIWDRYLPYAIAFGVDKQYMAKFAKVDAPIPGWYFPSPTLYGPYRGWYYGTPYGVPNPSSGGGLPREGGGGLGGGLSDASRGMGASMAAMSAGLGTMLSSASNTFTSRPASSSSGGGWSGGGGGFSGGGFSGGGGGGGGGGGFR
ncbi:MAG: DUF2207 domain-containing protein [Caldilineaceae bacterium]|nr:DUF2207 domain-containing protein [Caldilineaceae bacterium]